MRSRSSLSAIIICACLLCVAAAECVAGADVRAAFSSFALERNLQHNLQQNYGQASLDGTLRQSWSPAWSNELRFRGDYTRESLAPASLRLATSPLLQVSPGGIRLAMGPELAALRFRSDWSPTWGLVLGGSVGDGPVRFEVGANLNRYRKMVVGVDRQAVIRDSILGYARAPAQAARSRTRMRTCV